jgi:hypothetical protein
VTAQIFPFPHAAPPPPVPEFPPSPPPHLDVGLWEAEVDEYGPSPSAREARALIARAPNNAHPLVSHLRKIAGASNDQ